MSVITSEKNDTRQMFFHQDGLLDIFIGLGIFFASLFLWTEMVWMVGIFIPVFLPTFQASRKKILKRRSEYLDLDPQHQAQVQKIFFTVTMLFGIMLLAAIGVSYTISLMSEPVNEWLYRNILFVMGGVFAGIWIFTAVFLKINRFYLYAALTFVSLSVVQLGALPLWLAMSILGGLIALLGLLLLTRFLRQNPIRG